MWPQTEKDLVIYPRGRSSSVNRPLDRLRRSRSERKHGGADGTVYLAFRERAGTALSTSHATGGVTDGSIWIGVYFLTERTGMD